MLLLVKQWRLLPFTFLPNSSSFFKLSFSGWLSDPLVMMNGLGGELGDLLDSSLMLVKGDMVGVVKLV